jgi:hypothetical protein
MSENKDKKQPPQELDESDLDKVAGGRWKSQTNK